MDEAEVVIVARRETYRIVSQLVFVFNLPLLLATATILPWCLSESRKIFMDMGRAVPAATNAIIRMPTPIILVSLLLIAASIAKEIYAPPKARFWINSINLLALLVFWAFCVLAVGLPMSWPILTMLMQAR